MDRSMSCSYTVPSIWKPPRRANDGSKATKSEPDGEGKEPVIRRPVRVYFEGGHHGPVRTTRTVKDRHDELFEATTPSTMTSGAYFCRHEERSATA